MSTARRLAGVLVTLVVLGGLLAASADAKLVRYSGKTGQGKKVVLRTNAKGKAQYFTIQFRADCLRGHIDDGRERFVPPFRRADYGGFVDGGHARNPIKGYGIGRFRVHIEGERVDRDHVKGTFDFQARYFHHGEAINRCSAQNVHWSVSR